MIDQKLGQLRHPSFRRVVQHACASGAKAAHRSAFFDEQTRARLTSSGDGGGHRCASYVTCRYTEAEQKLDGVVIPILRGEQHQPIFRLRALACEKFQDG